MRTRCVTALDEHRPYLDIDSVPVPCWVYDPKTLAFMDVNAAACAAYGYSRDEFLAMSILDIRPPEDRENARRNVQEAGTQETVVDGPWRHLRRDGTIVEVDVAATTVDYGGREGRLVLMTDVSERQRVRERVAYLAAHDALTGLPNRKVVLQYLEREISRAQMQESGIAVLSLDIDGFRTLNDTLGHARGDELLRIVARRLEGAVPNGAAVGREGSDAFVIVVPNVRSIDEIAELARRLQRAIRSPVTLGRHEVVVDASVGISRYPEDGLDGETLVRHADTALVRAKARGHGSVQEFAARMHALALKRLVLENDLRRAWDRNELWLAYQPLVDLNSWRIVGAEALLRWRHPELGEIPPGDFIPVAEEIGMIAMIGEWVVNEACMQAVRWSGGDHAPRVTVNISPRQFQQHDLCLTIARALERTGLAPQRLELELTESCVMQDIHTSARIMRELKAMNVRLSVDDFGTGYSSLGYLKHFPIDTLKIDRMFIRDVDSDPFDRAIATAIVAVARSLNLRIVAEGVERAEHLDVLRGLGCDELQGFFFSEAVDPKVFGIVFERGFTAPAHVQKVP